MKKLILSLSVLPLLAACAGNGTSDADLDGTLTSGPYAEERTVGTTKAPARVVRSAAPVFESRQVK